MLSLRLPSENPLAGWVESRLLTDSEQAQLLALDESSLAGTLEVRVDGPEELPAIAGSVSLENGRLVFRPRFPWRSGLAYGARLQLPGQVAVASTFQLPQVETAARTRVLRVLPDTDAIPANLLRFYVEFSAPMEPGQLSTAIRLLDEEGGEIEDAFVETVPLWDAEQRRVTLICHPGRIKRGLELHERLGTPFREETTVTLEIPESLSDVNGHPLVEGYARSFTVLAADRSSPDPQNWTWSPLIAGSCEPFRIEFGEVLDAALAARMLWIELPDGAAVKGRASVRPDGSGWMFEPDSAWREARHTLRVDGRLEDLSGNRVDAPFERVLGEDKALDTPSLELCIGGCS